MNEKHAATMPVRARRALLGACVVCLTLAAAPVLAADLGQAKAAGYVGEQLDGYLGLVRADAPGDVKALVQDINRKRRAEYGNIAKKNGVPVEQVARLAAEKVIQQAAPGHYVQTPSGWKKR
jgi:uncharacterized protein YdbL (DUF1318 family)